MSNRLISASIGMPILLTAVWLGLPWYSAFIFIVAMAAALEMMRLAGILQSKLCLAFTLILTAFFITGAHTRAITGEPYSLLIPYLDFINFEYVMLAACYIAASRLAFDTGMMRELGFVTALRTCIYVGGFLSYAVLLRGLEQGREWTLLVLIAVMATDTTAFLVGRAIGKTPLAPRISPGKTREGAAAGFIGAITATTCATIVMGLGVIIWEALILGAIVGVMAQLGDLVESRIKRNAEVKDSGWLIPGHGGILDRIDSIVFALPAVYYFVIWEIQSEGGGLLS